VSKPTETQTREAIQRTAQKLREATGGQMTQTQAEQRVRAARERGDRIRETDRNR
jgi:hypothetical protein